MVLGLLKGARSCSMCCSTCMVRLAESKCIAAELPRVRDCRTGVDLVAGYTQLRYLHAFHSFMLLLASVLHLGCRLVLQ